MKEIHRAAAHPTGGEILKKDAWKSKHWRLLALFLTISGEHGDVLRGTSTGGASGSHALAQACAALSEEDRDVVVQLILSVAIRAEWCWDPADANDHTSGDEKEGVSVVRGDNTGAVSKEGWLVIKSITALVSSELSALEVQLLRLLGKQHRKAVVAGEERDQANAVLGEIARLASGSGADRSYVVVPPSSGAAVSSEPAVVVPPAPLCKSSPKINTRVAVSSPPTDVHASNTSYISPVTGQDLLSHTATSSLQRPKLRAAAVTVVAAASPLIAAAAPPPVSVIISRPCDLCEDDTGDLMECAECHSWLHEACGGPHPDDNLRVCKSCRQAMGLGDGSESSELNSQTSSDERVTTDDDDSSLDGFIVRTDDEDDEDEEELSESSSEDEREARRRRSGKGRKGEQKHAKSPSSARKVDNKPSAVDGRSIKTRKPLLDGSVSKTSAKANKLETSHKRRRNAEESAAPSHGQRRRIEQPVITKKSTKKR